MSTTRYLEEFSTEAVRQVAESGHTVADVARRLGVSPHGLFRWIGEAEQPSEVCLGQLSQA